MLKLQGKAIRQAQAATTQFVFVLIGLGKPLVLIRNKNPKPKIGFRVLVADHADHGLKAPLGCEMRGPEALSRIPFNNEPRAPVLGGSGDSASKGLGFRV